MNDSVQYERAGAIGYVTLNRPSVLNAMNDALLEGVAASLQSAHDDHEAHVVVVRGAGRAFCAGADLNDTPRRLSLDEYRRSRLELERDVARSVRRLAKPLIAQIHGAAIGGGCVLAMLCDMRIAASGTRFALPEVKVGTTASLGGVYMLTRIVGLGRAFELLYLGDTFDAERAHTIGLVNQVIPPERLEADVAQLATRLAGCFPAELALTREAILRGLEVDFLGAADFETHTAMMAHLGGDLARGLAAARARIKKPKKPS